MIEWYKKVVFQNYANFNGRARRSEYWYFTLANIIVSIILTLLDNALGTKFGNSGILNTIYSLGIFIPSLAVSVRRLHDIGKSGKLLLLTYGIMIVLVIVMVVSGLSLFMSGSAPSMSSLGVAFFGPLLALLAISIWMLVLFCTEGEKGSNKYGPDPKNDISEINEIGTSEL
ncbi:DUF805 domain-containing protein [Flavobacterium seoulense]|uniref:DUF805 domain-containing protein n=1 Tax=Flavobacterium seoulense TaxID=1492738 RepID=A0A066X0W0_9FLAO|nr:DUF805 domain-containing protein [Flavobacterium seoulense]KDN56560.1 hypothetical protein FEM21_00630 [Flavobacterium seoulense]